MTEEKQCTDLYDDLVYYTTQLIFNRSAWGVGGYSWDAIGCSTQARYNTQARELVTLATLANVYAELISESSTGCVFVVEVQKLVDLLITNAGEVDVKHVAKRMHIMVAQREQEKTSPREGCMCCDRRMDEHYKITAKTIKTVYECRVCSYESD